MRRSFQIPVAGLAIVALLMPTGIIGQETNQYRSAPTSVDCTFLRNPDQFLNSHELHRAEVSKWTETVRSRSGDGAARVVMPVEAATAPMPRKNFIDDYIFGRMEKDGVKPAPMSSDFEFLRRVTLDMTGRIPTLQDLYAFAGDPNPNKREQMIDKLVWSYEFLDKWTMFFGDLYKNSVTGLNVTRYQQGRDTFRDFIYSSLAANKPYDQMVREMIGGEGDNFVNGASNWLVGTTIAMGPVQDTYDGGAVHAAQMFLGVSTVDCLLCHDGARHLDSLNLWAKDEKRVNMQGLSAFFARARMTRQAIPQTNYAKFVVTQATTGDYMLNTNSGNRQPRTPVNGSNRVMPKYPWNGAAAAPDGNRLQALATALTSDIQFSRASVNYIWEKFMVEAFVSPSNQFDLARLDPKNPPPAPWTLQPTNPELLNAMGEWFAQSGYNIRLLMGTIAKSNTYQLSSDYPGEWKLDYVPYYARKFVRRLDAEEIHDAIVQATWILPSYPMDYTGSLYPLPAVSWAMKFADTAEPRSNNNTVQFLSAFGRGNRDQTPRDSSASVLQALNLMNHTFVMNRIHTNNNGSNVQWVTRYTTDRKTIVEHLFLSTLSRLPSPGELATGMEVMQWLGTQRGAESIQWALLNKLEFIFNY